MRRLGAARWMMTMGIFSLLASACSKHSDDAVPTPSATVSAAAASVSSSATAPAMNGSGTPGDTLYGKLAREAKARPNLKPNAEDAFAAIDKAGVAVPARNQSMGATYKAAYCTSGTTPDNVLAVMVCEYTSDADAKAGRDFAKTLFPNMTTRDIWAHKSNTLTVIQQTPGAVATANQKKAVDAFNAL